MPAQLWCEKEGRFFPESDFSEDGNTHLFPGHPEKDHPRWGQARGLSTISIEPVQVAD
jgi:hypothetical protein